MGGGGSTSYHIQNQLLSIKDVGGEYRDMNISTIEMTQHKNVPIGQIDLLLINHKIPKQKLEQIQKLKFSIKGEIQNLQFIIEESFFHGILYEVSTIKLQNGNFDLKVQIYKIVVIYEVPYSITHQIKDNQNQKFVGIRPLNVKEQEVIVQTIKNKINQMKTNKIKNYQGKVRLYDVIRNSIIYGTSGHFFSNIEWIKHDAKFTEYLKSKNNLLLIEAFNSVQNGKKLSLQLSLPYPQIVYINNKFINLASQSFAQHIHKSVKNTKFYDIITESKKSMDGLAKAYHQIGLVLTNKNLFDQFTWWFLLQNYKTPVPNDCYKQNIKQWKGYFPIWNIHLLYSIIRDQYDNYGKNNVKK